MSVVGGLAVSGIVLMAFLIDFLEQFWTHKKIKQKVQFQHMYHLPISIPITIDELTLIHHCHPKSMVYTEIHSECSFYGF